jgi:hypothetical protein
MNQLIFRNATVAASPPMAPAPYLYMAGDNSICDVADAANDNCRIIQVMTIYTFFSKHWDF